MTLTQKRLYLRPTRNSFCMFFPAKDIVSYREFICSPLYVRLKQLCPTRGLVEGFVRPIFSFSCSDKYPIYWQPLLILIIFNFPFLMQAVLSTTLTRGLTRGAKGAQFPVLPVTMGRQMTTGSPKSHNNVTSTFFNTLHLLPKYFRFESQTCFFPQAPSNLDTPLTLTRLLPLQLRFERISLS